MKLPNESGEHLFAKFGGVYLRFWGFGLRQASKMQKRHSEFPDLPGQRGREYSRRLCQAPPWDLVDRAGAPILLSPVGTVYDEPVLPAPFPPFLGMDSTN